MKTETCAYAARGLLHIKRAFSETELTRVYECLDGEGWLRTTDQAMCFSPLPAWVVQLSTRLRDLASTTGYVADAERHLFDFKQCIVNQYAPGDGLTPHVDLDAFGDVVASLSLLSTVAMEFVPVVDALGGSFTVRLDPGDVLFLRDDARWRWTHGIPSRDVDVFADGSRSVRAPRISLTLRTMVDDDGHLLDVPAPIDANV